MEKKHKVIVAVVAIAVIAVVLLAIGSEDDFDYKSQSKEVLDRFGYDTEIIDCEVEKGTNVFGVSIISISGTFVSDGKEHTFSVTTGADHEIMLVNIDGEYRDFENIGEATYNFRLSQIGSFEYEWGGGYTGTESPDAGKRFLLATVIVKNICHTGGLPIRAPELSGNDGNLYSYDWDATYHYQNSYTDYSDVSVGVGRTIQYNLIYQVPESVTGGDIVWDSMYIDLYGYVLDISLEIADDL